MLPLLPLLLVERREAVLCLTLNRPEKRNSLHPDLIAALSDEIAKAKDDASLAALIITGAGSSFCAGLDLSHLLSLAASDRVAYMRQLFDLFEQIQSLPQPLIVAVNGPAMAGGFDLAAFCDLRLAAPAAKFAQTEILLGITQILFPLYKSIGLTRAKELALTGDAISAEEAHRIGFINHLYPSDELLAQAWALGDKLAARPREALFATKALSRELMDADMPTAWRRMFDVIAERLHSDEHAAEVAKYFARLKEKK
jgi:enoyl-CoA hydratase/carnithine racemase